jgi:hypothetical protein
MRACMHAWQIVFYLLGGEGGKARYCKGCRGLSEVRQLTAGN